MIQVSRIETKRAEVDKNYVFLIQNSPPDPDVGVGGVLAPKYSHTSSRCFELSFE